MLDWEPSLHTPGNHPSLKYMTVDPTLQEHYLAKPRVVMNADRDAQRLGRGRKRQDAGLNGSNYRHHTCGL